MIGTINPEVRRPPGWRFCLDVHTGHLCFAAPARRQVRQNRNMVRAGRGFVASPARTHPSGPAHVAARERPTNPHILRQEAPGSGCSTSRPRAGGALALTPPNKARGRGEGHPPKEIATVMDKRRKRGRAGTGQRAVAQHRHWRSVPPRRLHYPPPPFVARLPVPLAKQSSF